MARKITREFTLDDCEDEIIFTASAVAADPDTEDLREVVEGWLALVDGARVRDREARIAAGQASAARVVANGRLDDACQAFGDDLNLAVKKERGSARFARFFPRTVSAFVRQRLATQAVAVRSWLAVKDDDVLERHRAALERWCVAAEKALAGAASSVQVRGQFQVARESLAESLTRERDGLEAKLVARAHERGLPRDWPGRFFRTESAARAEQLPPEAGSSAVS
jgi:hypothetical protein